MRTGGCVSSTIWSRTSTSSSTSDSAARTRRGAGLGARAVGLVRLTHPFPSVLDGIATAALAAIAGAAAPDAVRLGLGMTALQAAIGAVNDVVDAPSDAVGKPSKPIPSGLVPLRLAATVAVAAAGIGLVLSAAAGWGTAAIAVGVLAIGLSYDVWLKGTAWSWLPFAVGIPVLPVYAWYGGVGALPAAFSVLIPAAVAAGAGLAIGNARADLERDVGSGVSSIATRLGSRRAWGWEVGLFGGVAAVAVLSVIVAGGGLGQALVVAVAGVIPVVAAALSRDVRPAARERAWEAEAVGVAVLAAAWLWVALG
ncbi:MAG: UbiA family prenyltransferase [Chloroflexota bacterium]